MISAQIPIFASTAARDLIAVFDAIPVIPGRLVLMLFALLSLATWAVIFAKIIDLKILAKADMEFKNRLRRTKGCLEVFEQGVDYDSSPCFTIYAAGARETVSQSRLGYPLSSRQVQSVNDAFARGERSVSVRLGHGLRWLKTMAVLPLVLGLVAACWITLEAFLEGAKDRNIVLGQVLLVIIGSVAVAVPAIIARMNLLYRTRSYAFQIQRFRGQLVTVFHEFFKLQNKPEPESQIVRTPNETLPSHTQQQQQQQPTNQAVPPPRNRERCHHPVDGARKIAEVEPGLEQGSDQTHHPGGFQFKVESRPNEHPGLPALLASPFELDEPDPDIEPPGTRPKLTVSSTSPHFQITE